MELCGPEVIWKTKDKSRRPTLCMALEGGLCLLRRLKNLGTLRVGIRDANLLIKKWDVVWMLPSRPSAGDARLKEEKEEHAREQLQAKVVQRRLCTVEKWMNDTEIGESTLEVLLQLVHCGLLLDVEMMIKDPDNEDVECWPELRRLALYLDCSFGQRCE